ncbi:hypothetical protein [Calothrix sp. 336/3]|nr:hypothetical protein [Calothrix sp. 336/3]
MPVFSLLDGRHTISVMQSVRFTVSVAIFAKAGVSLEISPSIL